MLSASNCTLRPYRDDDIPLLPATIGLPEVVRWMSHRIPHPYALEDARAWVKSESARVPVTDFAIEVDGTFAGGIGIVPRDGEFSGVAEIGYWLAPAFWGRGIATAACRRLSAHAFGERGVRRLAAWVFAPNVASARVLEGSGFIREGVLRSGITSRDGTICDALLYGRLATDPAL